MNIRRARTVMAVAAVAAFSLLAAAVTPAGASTGQAAGDTGGSARCHAGAPGVGDDYYPLYGNGGYDGGWSLGEPYVIVLAKGGNGITYRIAARIPARDGVDYQRCPPPTFICQQPRG